MTIDWDDAFDNSGYVPNAWDIVADLEARSAAYRDSNFARCGLSYGLHPRQKFDLFMPDRQAPKGVVVFVHGGYWMRLDRHYWSVLAEGARAKGWAVAMPGYPLTPEVRITDIVASIRAALTQIAEQCPGPVRLVGHSAGGHLVARMACADGPLADRLVSVTSISGLHDLRNFLLARSMNKTLGLTEAETLAQSPALLQPRDGVAIHAWVGAEERPELVRQSQLLADAWPGTALTIEPERNHFDVILDMERPDSPLTKAILGEL